jgi:hypothetical protein
MLWQAASGDAVVSHGGSIVPSRPSVTYVQSAHVLQGSKSISQTPALKATCVHTERYVPHVVCEHVDTMYAVPGPMATPV